MATGGGNSHSIHPGALVTDKDFSHGDRNPRFHLDDRLAPSPGVDDLLAEIDQTHRHLLGLIGSHHVSHSGVHMPAVRRTYGLEPAKVRRLWRPHTDGSAMCSTSREAKTRRRFRG